MKCCIDSNSGCSYTISILLSTVDSANLISIVRFETIDLIETRSYCNLPCSKMSFLQHSILTIGSRVLPDIYIRYLQLDSKVSL